MINFFSIQILTSVGHLNYWPQLDYESNVVFNTKKIDKQLKQILILLSMLLLRCVKINKSIEVKSFNVFIL